MKVRHLAVGMAVAFVVAGCGGSADASREAAPSNAAAGPASYASVVELRDAYVETGVDCAGWVQDDVVKSATESGHCSEKDVLAVFTDHAQARASAEALVTMYRDMGVGGSVLLGDNWWINTDAASSLASSPLGGEVLSVAAGGE